jgi:hypothetical protein
VSIRNNYCSILIYLLQLVISQQPNLRQYAHEWNLLVRQATTQAAPALTDTAEAMSH